MLIVIGLIIFLYPIMMKEINEARDLEEIEAFQETIKKEIQRKEEYIEESTEEQTEETEKIRIYESLYRQMQEYNKKIYENGQKELFDPFSSPDSPFNLSQYELKDDMIGFITIPRLNLSMKLYLGATKEHLSDGIGVLSNTSMPLGGNNTNCVLAGHRGSKTKKFFYGIEKLEIGDEIELTTPWDNLTYQVESVKVITPDEVDAVMIQKNKDMITLITCHPYGMNYQRYLVYATRKESKKEDKKEYVEKTEDNVEKTEDNTEHKDQSVVHSDDPYLYIEDVIRKGIVVILALFVIRSFLQMLKKSKSKI